MPDVSVIRAARQVNAHRDLLRNLTQRELRSRYRRSVLGWGWSLLQPLLMTAVYAIMLGGYFGLDAPRGDPSGLHAYVLFLLSGLLPWNFFAVSLTTGMSSIINGGSLITRVYFPRLVLPLSTIIAMAYSLCIELTLLAFVVTVFARVMVLQFLPVLALLVVLQIMFTSGATFWLAACNVRFRDVEYLTTVALLAYLYLTPVIYSITFIPDTPAFGSRFSWREIALVNPMARFMMAYRNLLYDARLPGLNTILWLVGWSLLMLVAGTRFFQRRAPRFAEMM